MSDFIPSEDRRTVQTYGKPAWKKTPLADPARVDRLPPHSIEAEQGVLGCILLSPNDCLSELLATGKFQPEIFYDLRHRVIFQTLAEMFEKRDPIDLVTIQQRLRDRQQLENIGGLGYISSLEDAVPSVSHLDYYGEIIYEKYLRRLYIQVLTEGITRLYAEGETEVEPFDSIERDFLAVSQQRIPDSQLSWKEIITRVIDQIEEYHRGGAQMLGISTGFGYLDKVCCGLEPGGYYVVGGRPGTGKTSLAFNILEHVVVDLKIPSGIFTVEMSGRELGSRSLAQRARTDFQRFRTGFLENSDIPKLLSAAGPMANAPIQIDERGDINIAELRAQARRWHAQHGIRLLVIDYLQLVSGTRNYREEREEVKEVSKGIKRLAKELQIPIIAVAQLNRELDKEKNRVPRMSDLGDSGGIERDADFIGILYEPKLTDDEQAVVDEERDWAKHSKRMNLQVCKQRNGPTGKVEFLFMKSCMRFLPYHRHGQNEEAAAPPKKALQLPSNEELAME